MLALLGVAPALPIIQYYSGGIVNYNSTLDTYSIAATPLTIDLPSTPTGFFDIGAVNINSRVDSTGADWRSARRRFQRDGRLRY